MSATELKNSLIQRIQKIEDPEVLKSILKIVVLEQEMHSSKKHQLHPDFEKKLDNVLNDIKAGYYLTEEEANREIDQWLEE